MEKNRIYDWLLRFLKGAVIGMDVLLPGISGAALAVAFGLYERIVQFIAHITKDFVKNVLFFIPVVSGALLGIFLISFPIRFLLENFKTPFYWFVVGTILGTMPELWRRSGEKGRKPLHIGVLISIIVLAIPLFLYVWALKGAAGATDTTGMMHSISIFTAFGSGAMFALVAFIPGFSSATFLLLLGLYDPVTAAIKARYLPVLIPFGLGIVTFAFPFSKGIEFLLKKTFTGFFHVIIGFVLASAAFVALIASDGYDYMQIGTIACLFAFVGGGAFSYWMCKLSNKYGV